MKVCPFCKTRLREYNYGSYYDPPEYGEECINKKCMKYAVRYFYYDGFNYQCNKWNGNNDKEFGLRMKYHRRKNFK